MKINVNYQENLSYVAARIKRTSEYKGKKFDYYSVIINDPTERANDFAHSVLGNQSPADYQKQHGIAWNE